MHKTPTVSSHMNKLLHTIQQWSSLKSRISFRLSLLVSFLALMLVSGGGMGLYVISETEAEFNHLFIQRMSPLGRLLSIQKHTLEIHRIVLNSIIAAQEDEGPEQYLAQIDALIVKINEQWKLANLNTNSDELKTLLNEYKNIRYTVGAENVFPIMAALRAGEYEEAVMIEAVAGDSYSALEAAINNIVQYQLKTARSEIENSIHKNNIYRIITFVAISGALFVAFIFSLIIIRSVTAPLKKAVKLANHVSKGSLTDRIEVHSNDETGQLLAALNTMSMTLRNIVSEVLKDVEGINEGSRIVAESNNELADKVSQQTISLDLTATHMEDVVTTNRNTAEAAAKAHKLAESARNEAENGGKIIKEAMTAMNAIYNSSGKISDITTTIDSIAFQTNLLALNASVEAARAGEQGRGFAVVANEVRRLSQSAAKAAKEIKTLIDNSTIQIKSGKELVDKSGKALISIEDNTHNVADIVETINIASVKQTTGIDEINRAIDEMRDSFQHSASTIINSAVTSDTMAEQVSALMELMAFFKLDGNTSNNDLTERESNTINQSSLRLKQKPTSARSNIDYRSNLAVR